MCWMLFVDSNILEESQYNLLVNQNKWYDNFSIFFRYSQVIINKKESFGLNFRYLFV